MTRTLTALAAAGALAAGSFAIPTKAEAMAPWVVPVIIAGGVLTAGAAVAATGPYYGPGYVEPRGNVYVRPSGMASSCHWARERVPGGWRRVEVCD